MIYVTGSSGLIGTALCQQISYVKISYRDNVDSIEFLSKPNTTLIHLASCSNTRYGVDSAEELYQKEVLTSLELFRKFYKANPDGRIIFLSSCGDLHWSYINGPVLTESLAPTPKTIHGSHKILIESYGQILAKESGGKFISLRVSNVYGGKIDSNRINGLVDRYFYCLENNQSMEIYCNPQNTYDWIHIDDVVDCIIQSISYLHSDVFLVGSGESLSVKEVLDHLCETEGKVDITYKEVQEKPTYVRISCAKIYTRLGWEPIHRLII
jgi:UDP-glucose 4-epimerase